MDNPLDILSDLLDAVETAGTTFWLYAILAVLVMMGIVGYMLFFH